ncbi:MAG: S1C family serine protease [Pirellulaceae bacterium]|nr:S1C family serine protease [Pirellulaceae bacterium]
MDIRVLTGSWNSHLSTRPLNPNQSNSPSLVSATWGSLRGWATGTVFALALLTNLTSGQLNLPATISEVQPKLVKIYGAGGIRGLEAYQSGFLISETGHVLTAWSYVLDTDYITAVLDDGRKFKAELVGADPRSEIAVLKIDVSQVPFFALDKEVSKSNIGDRILAFSNLYGIAAGNEPASVLHGHIAAITNLQARRGVYKTAYDGPVYIVDAMTNNAGAAGGALTTFQGELLGILGKELRNAQTNTWLNFAIPITSLKSTIEDILAGRVRREREARRIKPEQHLTPALLGLVLIPDVLPKTPPFVERVIPHSAAAEKSIRSDDLILFVGPNMVQSRQELIEELSYIDRLDEVAITVLRNQQLMEVELTAQD